MKLLRVHELVMLGTPRSAYPRVRVYVCVYARARGIKAIIDLLV